MPLSGHLSDPRWLVNKWIIICCVWVSCHLVVFRVIHVYGLGVSKEHLPPNDRMGWRTQTKITWMLWNHTFLYFLFLISPLILRNRVRCLSVLHHWFLMLCMLFSVAGACFCGLKFLKDRSIQDMYWTGFLGLNGFLIGVTGFVNNRA